MELSPYLNFNGECAAAFRFNAQCLGGKIVAMKTFWSSGFGTAVDRFGIPWMVNCEQAA